MSNPKKESNTFVENFGQVLINFTKHQDESKLPAVQEFLDTNKQSEIFIPIKSEVPVTVNRQTGEYRLVDIGLNQHGNLVLRGIDSVTYEMLDDELWLIKTEE